MARRHGHVDDRAAEHLLAPPPEHRLGGGVELDDGAGSPRSKSCSCSGR
jgi:hypothetical protein